MTVADSAPSAENVAAPRLYSRHGRAASVTTPLPDGWRSFCSKPDQYTNEPGRWYAVAPYDAETINQEFGLLFETECLMQTVHAESWQTLHAVVEEQVARHVALMGCK